MDRECHWINRRSRSVDRLQREEEIEARRRLYKTLETILEKESPDGVVGGRKRCSSVDSLNSSPQWKLELDSALGDSVDQGVLDSTSAKFESCHLTDPPVAGWTDAHKVSCQGESSQTVQPKEEEVTKPEPGTGTAEQDEWELAEEFHAALGGELDTVRNQIAAIIDEGPLIFPFELYSQFYIRHGRRLPQIYEKFSYKSFLAWLKHNSSLNLKNLILDP